MSDEPLARDGDEGEQEHPLESPEALRLPRDEDDEERDRAPQPGVTPDLDDR